MKGLRARLLEAGIGDDFTIKRDGTVEFRRGYFYRMDRTAQKFGNHVLKRLAEEGFKATLLRTDDHWAPFKGGGSVKQNSHFLAVVRIDG